MKSAFTSLRQRVPDATSLAFLVVAFLSGSASALQVPTLSLFLTEKVGVNPFLVGVFYAVNAIGGIVIGQAVAHYSDHGGNRRRLIVACCLAGFAGSLLFAFSRHYWLLISVGVALGSLGGAANPQTFALAREHGDRDAREAGMFTAIMRAQISLAWVIGPPLAFVIAAGYGFTDMYLCSGLAFVIGALCVAYRLPSPRPRERRPGQRGGWNKAIRLPFVTSTLMWTCNGLYLIDMPLYVTRTLHLPAHTAGVLMSIAAGLEIPAMLLAGAVIGRFGKLFLLRLAAMAGVVFYVGMSLFQQPVVLMALQLANAVFIGIVASIGMLIFQDTMPEHAGTASTLFMTSTRTGTIVAGDLTGVIASLWGYHGVMFVNVGFASLALMCSWRLHRRG